MRKFLQACALLGAALLSTAESVSAQPVRAVWSERFVESVGVNIHLHYTDSSYVTRWPQVRDLLVDSGIRHIRDGLNDTHWQPYYNRINELGAAGIGATLITQWDQSPELIASYANRVQRLDALEAPNEADHRPFNDWDDRLRRFQLSIKQATRTYRTVPIIGPSLTSEEAYGRLGDLSESEDYGNMHDYFGGHNPETSGWGARHLLGIPYGSLSYNLNSARQASHVRSIVATETGYTNDLNDKQGIPENISGRYIPRLLLLQFAAGVPRSFIYEFLDENLPGREGHFGLLTSDLRPKPAFLTLRSLLQSLSDSGPSFKPDTIDLDLQTDTDDVHDVVLEKRSHTLTIALWRGVSSYDLGTRRSTPVYPVQVVLHIAHANITATTAASFDDAGHMVPHAVTKKNGSLLLSIDDHLTLLTVPLALQGKSSHV